MRKSQVHEGRLLQSDVGGKGVMMIGSDPDIVPLGSHLGRRVEGQA